MRMQTDPSSPLTRILGFIVGVLVLITAVIIGSFVLSAFIGLALLAGVAFYARLWWLSRKIRRAMERGETPPGQRDRIIETEYHVVEVSEENDRSDRDAEDARKR